MVPVPVVPSAIGGWTSPPLRGPTSLPSITIIPVPVPIPVPILSVGSSTWTARTIAIAARTMRRLRRGSTPVVTPNGRRGILGPLKMSS